MFKQHYPFVCQAIYRILRDRHKTEDVAQEVFAELWSKRDQLHIHTSVPAYLRRMAVSRALNYIRDSRKHQWQELDPPETGETTPAVEPEAVLALEENELRQRIEAAISQLPDKCRIVFLLSRVEEMSYGEISDHLGISVKTVENQIGKALRLLRLTVAGHRG